MLARISNYFETFSSQEYLLPDSEKDKLDDYFNKYIVNSKNDKENYTQYYNLCVDKLKSGGIIIADNVLWYGKVVAPNSYDDELTQYLIDFNEMVKNDDRVENIILPLRDGLNIIIKN